MQSTYVRICIHKYLGKNSCTYGDVYTKVYILNAAALLLFMLILYIFDQRSAQLTD